MSVSLLGSEIGRGHPFYSDGLVRALELAGRGDVLARRASVFQVSRGLSLAAWKAVRASYRTAGRGGAVSSLYHRLRGTMDYDRESFLLRVLGRDLKRWAGEDGVVVVDHPAVVGALGGRADVWYFHGELVAPPEAVVRRAARVLVPREDVAGEFVRGGLRPEQVLVTGVCVENELVDGAPGWASARRERIRSGAPLTIAFFSSGAEPVAHVETLAAGAAAVAASPHRAIVFAARGGRLEAAVRREAARTGSAPEVVTFDGRAELDRLTAERFALFDAVVTPPHERSNWAVALGVPFLLVGPDIGPFAPRNRALLLGSGVAAEIADAADARKLPETIERLRADGRLLRMSENGADPAPRGFRRAAELLADEVTRRGG